MFALVLGLAFGILLALNIFQHIEVTVVFPIEAVEHKAQITIDYDAGSNGILLFFKMDPTIPENDDEPFYIPVEDAPAVIAALTAAYEQVTGKKP